MKYDDGFIAYLNGVVVASRNAPAAPAWNSVATAQHDDAQAIIFEPINISSFLSSLRVGTNVLAIQGLNSSLTSTDMLIVPELTGSSTTSGDPILLSPPVQ